MKLSTKHNDFLKTIIKENSLEKSLIIDIDYNVFAECWLSLWVWWGEVC